MNSPLLHFYERILFYTIVLGVIAIASLYVFKIGTTIKQGILWMFYLIVIGLILYIHFKFKKWKKNGYKLSKSLGLNHIVIFETSLVTSDGQKLFELHHKPTSVIQGYRRLRKPKSQIINELKQDLKRDFSILYEWSLEKNVNLVTVTHESMFQIWDESSDEYFNGIATNQIKDKYVKPNIFSWLLSSFSTTGRFSPRPKKWGAFLLVRK